MKWPPVRVYSGIYEISKYIRELLGNDDLSKIPERIDLEAVKIENMKNALYFYSFPDPGDNTPYYRVLEKNNNVVDGVLCCGGCDKDYSLSMQIDLFRDVRRIEEYEGDGGRVIKVYLSNKDICVYIVRKDKPDAGDGAGQPEPDDNEP